MNRSTSSKRMMLFYLGLQITGMISSSYAIGQFTRIYFEVLLATVLSLGYGQPSPDYGHRITWDVYRTILPDWVIPVIVLGTLIQFFAVGAGILSWKNDKLRQEDGKNKTLLIIQLLILLVTIAFYALQYFWGIKPTIDYLSSRMS